MAFRKKNIPMELQLVQQRLDGMKSVDPALDLGNGVSVPIVEAAIKKATDGIGEYNTMLSQIDQKGNDVDGDIKTACSFGERILTGAKFKFGKDSSEYEAMGGTRASERKKSSKKTPPKP
jgi:hypothetical protein